MKKILLLSALMICAAHPVTAMSSQPTTQEEEVVTTDAFLNSTPEEQNQHMSFLLSILVNNAKEKGVTDSVIQCAANWVTPAHTTKIIKWSQEYPAQPFERVFYIAVKKDCPSII